MQVGRQAGGDGLSACVKGNQVYSRKKAGMQREGGGAVAAGQEVMLLSGQAGRGALQVARGNEGARVTKGQE